MRSLLGKARHPINMPPNSPHASHAVAEVLTSVLSKACDSNAPPVVNLDLPSHTANSDDDVTIVGHLRATPPDDDIQIVSTVIKTRPRISRPCPPQTIPHMKPTQPDTIDLDLDETLHTPPSPMSVPSPSSPDVVLCNTSKSPTPDARPLCTICLTVLHPLRRPLSRCKHFLCPTCLLNAVLFNEDGAPPLLRHLPVCIVPRCAAPLATSEAALALAPPQADLLFQPALEKFHSWVSSVSSEGFIGPSNIHFPPYDPDSLNSSNAVNSDGSLAGMETVPDELMSDDFVSAVAPLWVWDHEHKLASGKSPGAWLCAACGEYDSQLILTPQPSDSVVLVDADTSNSLIPDSPAYPHCSNARALGVMENIKGLSDAREEGEGKKRLRRSSRCTKPPATAGKRYKYASSLRSVKRRKTGFAKGTGYAGNSGAEWRGTSSKMAEQKARLDRETTFWLLRLRCFLLLSPDASPASWPGFMRLLLRECKLVPKLASILITESIMDVQERVPLFASALRIVHALTESPSLRLLIIEPFDDDKGRSIAELVESLSRQAAFLTTGAGSKSLPPFTAVLVKQIRRCIRVINRNNLLELSRSKALPDAPVDVDVAVQKMEDKTVDPSSASDPTGKPPILCNEEGSDQDISFEGDKLAYIEQMRGYQFKAVPGLASTSSFRSDAFSSHYMGAPQNKRQARIAGEVASLFSSLPLSWSSSILLRVDEDRYDFLRACIFGPEGTPYDSGAFIFDIFLPFDYPNVPPNFRLLTTGGGKVRFNPNLYNNGKVCLSLLGTWSGPSWNSSSTILQVLVSIQSLILVSDPYFNEPGYESKMGTNLGKVQSSRYNTRVRQDTAFHAIHSNIKNCFPELKDGIYTHFRLKRRYIKHTLYKWFPYALESRQGSVKDPNLSNGSGGLSVSVDPTLQPLSFGMGQAATGAAAALSNVFGMSSETNFSTFEPGRNFCTTHMSAANLQNIIKLLDNIE